MSRSRNPTTTSVERDELPIQEFIRRQRLRNESISCSRSPHRPFSPTPSALLPPPAPPPSATPSPAPPLPPNPPSTSPTRPSPLTPLLTLLLLLLSTIHHLLGPTLQPLRFRTYNSTTSHQITRLQFLTTILPTTLLHPGSTANTPTRPPPPFAPLNPTHTYALAARSSLQHLLALHAPVAAEHVPVLAGARYAAYPAVRALGALEARLRLDEGGEEIEGKGAVAARVADVQDAVRALQRASERWAVEEALLEGEGGVESALRVGLREVNGLTAAAQPPAGRSGTADTGFLWWRGSKAEGKKGDEQTKDQRVDWRLRTACQAAAFSRTLDEVEERRVPALLELAEDVRRAAGMVDKAILGACRGVGEVLERADLVCADALAVLWRELQPRGSASVEDIQRIWKAKVEAAAAAEATIKDLEILKEEVRMQRDGIDVWMMFLERVPGETVEERCPL
ncbi:hypothetical protein DIS24_g11314 [Lasiodiplodia hormozganensis]|uniref:Uncharacterized protein n=1 Tax=Lasiodiplodia hormozganensis TaxID=869390 RepID=A0AA39WV74_9PEZI|nr:hypothetical protein DIS24_g11314 [Lasiodiplodia hormozganensis]